MTWDQDRPAAAEFHRVPAPLVPVFDFVNTLDARSFGGRSTSDDLPDWLGEHTEDEAALAVRLRTALRRLTEANRDGTAAKPGDFDALAAELPLMARVGGLAPIDGGCRGRLEELLASVVIATADGSWARMKTCGAPDCQWVFYDHSKPRNARWCSTAGCGNRMKTRAYRARA